MSIWYKQGVYGPLEPEAADGLRRTEKLYAMAEADVYITSIRDGAHGPGSLHPWGYAWDMRPGPVTIDEHRRYLGRDFDVLDHGVPPHRHIEYDPKEV